MDGARGADSVSHDNEQLFTPALTPVPEDPPQLQNDSTTAVAADQVNGASHDIGDSSASADGDPPTPASSIRNRSVSVPLEPLRITHVNNHDNHIASEDPVEVEEPITNHGAQKQVRKLSSARIQELTSRPESLPIRVAHEPGESIRRSTVALASPAENARRENGFLDGPASDGPGNAQRIRHRFAGALSGNDDVFSSSSERDVGIPRTSLPYDFRERDMNGDARPHARRTTSNPQLHGHGDYFVENHRVFRHHRKTGEEDDHSSVPADEVHAKPASAAEFSIPLGAGDVPLPPFSLPTFLHLELAAERPSPLYISAPAQSDAPYESSSVKFERLLNFFLLTPLLERVLLFGALACLDAWLYPLTILPLRFLRALWMLVEWAGRNTIKEIRDLANFVYVGVGRVWDRRKRTQNRLKALSESAHAHMPNNTDAKEALDASSLHSNDGINEDDAQLPPPRRPVTPPTRPPQQHTFRRHRRSRSIPSLLQPSHKADLLHGLLILVSCMILVRFDASRMYHNVRLQSTIKLYVIYNSLEVCDRLFSALGQDIIECLFSPETLERKPNGRSKIIRPLWMFLLALVYTIIHATSFFYQVITLNVAVNSSNNQLLTLLISNQFVEIKGTVFKKFEKENLFQLTCADVVERFQLWLMLVIIALRNIVDLGGSSAASASAAGSSTSPFAANATSDNPFSTISVLSNAFTVLPTIFRNQLLGPIVYILGSEMLVDWLKHAYITKFNATTPKVYSRYLDVLAKDYYSNAFASQNLIRRLGLPIVPLACIFIRAILQTYHKFLATNITAPAVSAATSLTEANATASPAIVQIDHIFRNALGRSTFGGGSSKSAGPSGMWRWTLDDAIALVTMLVFFLAVYLILLAFKLVLGMVLLSFARRRYVGMAKREREGVVDTRARRVGPYGTVQIGEDRRQVIYDGDPQGLKVARDRERKGWDKEAREAGKGDRLEGVDRYQMVGKRIW